MEHYTYPNGITFTMVIGHVRKGRHRPRAWRRRWVWHEAWQRAYVAWRDRLGPGNFTVWDLPEDAYNRYTMLAKMLK